MIPNQEKRSPLLREREAAARLSVTPAALRKWRSIGRGPRFLRLGSRMIRYHENDLQHFMEQGTVYPFAKMKKQ
jgi:predicted DNA-binding transcriptional regulator AlpA